MSSAWSRFAVVLLSFVVACGEDAGSGPDAGDPDSGIPSSVRPGKRSDVAGVAQASTGRIALFGGDNGPIVNQIPSPAYVGDTWLFDPVTGWEEIQVTTAPSARGRHAVAGDPAGKMLLFGGRFRPAGQSGDYTLFGDLWSFDFDARTWTMLDAGTGPDPRYFAAAAYDASADAFYIFGGGTNTDPLALDPQSDVWQFKGGVWSEITTSGNAPSRRLFVSYTYDSQRNRLVLFGGQVGDFVTPSFNDLHAVDLGTGQWMPLHTGSGTAPSGRFSSMMAYDAASDRYIMTGGHADLGVTNDVWAFDPVGGNWSVLHSGDTFTNAPLGCLGNPREIPSGYVDQDLGAPERRSGGVFALVDTQMWLFGGESDCSDHLDDTWRFDLSTAQWQEMIESRSGESCDRRNDDCQCLCL